MIYSDFASKINQQNSYPAENCRKAKTNNQCFTASPCLQKEYERRKLTYKITPLMHSF